MRLEKAGLSDCEALAVLARSAHSHPWSAAQYRGSLESGHTCWIFRAGDSGDQVSAGIAACCVVSRLFDEMEILDVAVAPEWRRRGVAGRLLQEIFSRLPEDVARVLLEVRASNRPARALYHKLGFSEDGRRKNYYPKPDGSREDALLMSLVL
ncbi:ribosomal protein S18-alanine N-acetyltransferase [Microbulbifer hydrolyticus]|uniref:[Ribosomal protein bS18]-alanine N-acetyltransferase n=1 Tax=Microbulbifer hydrolyticus TaxID=48074 RepID=A0A6P1T9L6_9GAMM|nr:ribosomal protein S18-alanine N-acetyltransferase [Microbulbifer hydrolyticus]MBB5212925.1 ribosomal-protein-alanine N-acetyltransferase [Microbulbifer hydrolyticus]QHQ38290.1 ribosomal protein S18-alanine N-acetyltransferase [Microbulbifer hydrolyticus]